MHLSTNFGQEIRRKKSPGTNGLTAILLSTGGADTLVCRCEKLAFSNPNNLGHRQQGNKSYSAVKRWFPGQNR